MKNIKKSEKEVPSISIEEALKLYLATALPDGMPEAIDPDLLLQRLQAFIAKDHPEWSKRFKDQSTATPEEVRRSYAKVKQEIIEKALKEDIPTDPEERYLYERRKEAKLHRAQKAEEEKTDSAKQALIQKVLAKKKADEAQKEKEVIRIKEALKKKVMESLKTKGIDPEKFTLQKQVLDHQQSGSSLIQNLSLETSKKLSSKFSQEKIDSWNKLAWNPSGSLLNKHVFKGMELTEKQKDKLVALDTFHEMRRQNMYKRSEVIKPLEYIEQSTAQRFDLNVDDSREEKIPSTSLSHIEVGTFEESINRHSLDPTETEKKWQKKHDLDLSVDKPPAMTKAENLLTPFDDTKQPRLATKKVLMNHLEKRATGKVLENELEMEMNLSFSNKQAPLNLKL